MIFLRKKRISRRTFLQGTGVCLSLPLLESMAVASTGTRNVDNLRLGFYFVPHGAVLDKWQPAKTGALELSPTLQPLEPFRSQLNVISDLALPLAYTEDASAAANHSSSSAVFLSGARMHKNTNLLGVTVDQVAARYLGRSSLLPSIELGIEDSSNSCGEGWSCAYRDTISWLDERTPLPIERNPQVLFERLFGTGATDAARASNRIESRSILDAVNEQTVRLQKDLPVADRRRLDQYLTDVREIERRMQIASRVSSDVQPPAKPFGIPTDFEDHLKTLFDLQVLAWQAGMTRISSLMLAVEASNAAYPKSGVRDAFHPLSHHSNIQENKDKLAQINRYHIGLFGYLLEKMRQTPDGEGTLLDHSILMWGSGMGDSNVHNHDPLPILLAGGGAGLKGGRHISAAGQPNGEGRKTVPLSNLHLSLLHKAGIEMETFGDSTGTVDL
jgi:hypothetical protein